MNRIGALRFLAAILIGLWASIGGTGIASAEKRIALVVGNSDYKKFPALKNPVNDARAVADALKKLNFEVEVVTDLDGERFLGALGRLSDKAFDADAVIFYYAGHGMEKDRTGYLLPTNVDGSVLQHPEFSSMPTLEKVTQALSRSRGPKVLIVDACRNNPFSKDMAVGELSVRNVSTRAISTDAASEERAARDAGQDAGMLIVYSTAADQVAYDGVGDNGPFAQALIKRFAEPGVAVTDLLHEVASDVDLATNHKQRTSFTDSLIGSFKLNQGENDVQDWDKVKSSDNPDDFDNFIKRHPTSPNALMAQRLRDLMINIRKQSDSAKAAADAAATADKQREATCKRETDTLAKLVSARNQAGVEALKASAACPTLGPAVAKALDDIHAAQQLACASERRQLDAIAEDPNALRAALANMTCENVQGAAKARIASIEDKRAKEKAAADKLAVELAAQAAQMKETCKREGDTLAKMIAAHDEAGLDALGAGAGCASVASSVAKARADAHAFNIAAACANDRKAMSATANDLAALRAATTPMTCDAARGEAMARIAKLEDALNRDKETTERQAALAAAEKARAEVCARETESLKVLTTAGAEADIEAMRGSAKCASIGPMIAKALETARATKRTLACANDKRSLDAAGSDVEALSAAVAPMTCDAVRGEATMRLAKLQQAHQQETAAAQQAQAACEAARNQLDKMDPYEKSAHDKLVGVRDHGGCKALEGEINRSLELVTSKVKDAQQQLARLSCLAGPADGNFDARTLQGVRSYYDHAKSTNRDERLTPDFIEELQNRAADAGCATPAANVAKAPAAPQPAPAAAATTVAPKAVVTAPVKVHEQPRVVVKPKPTVVVDNPKPRPPPRAEPSARPVAAAPVQHSAPSAPSVMYVP